jgi:methylthioribulose-1-phosphate dehydratase
MEAIHAQKTALVQVIHFLHGKGWAPATSSNYSFRMEGATEFYVSQSGKDKGDFTTADFLQVNADGQPIEDARTPSAETTLHCMLYKLYPEVHCVLHTHTALNTVLSQHFQSKKQITFENYEVLKGFSGIKTHEVSVKIPIFANSQDVPTLAEEVLAYAQQNPGMRAFLLSGHGMYTWGATIQEAKRHCEVVEFLLECEYLKLHL